MAVYLQNCHFVKVTIVLFQVLVRVIPVANTGSPPGEKAQQYPETLEASGLCHIRKNYYCIPSCLFPLYPVPEAKQWVGKGKTVCNLGSYFSDSPLPASSY